jgi:predicted ArsR family transcriptional regulator
MAFRIKQNDTSPSLQATLKDASGSSVNITGATVKFHMKSLEDSIKIDAEMEITDAEGGVVQYNWSASDTDTVETYRAEFEVTYADASVETFPNNGNVSIIVSPELN